MRRERMTHRVACGALGNGGLADCLLEMPLQGDFMEVVAGDPSGARMRAEGGGGEKVLPAPLPAGVGPFAQQGFWHVDFASADGEVLKVFFSDCIEVGREAIHERLR